MATAWGLLGKQWAPPQSNHLPGSQFPLTRWTCWSRSCQQLPTEGNASTRLLSQRNDHSRLTGIRTAVRAQLPGSVRSGPGSCPSPVATPAAAPAAGTGTIPFCGRGSAAGGPKCPSQQVTEQGSEHRQSDPGPERQTRPSVPHAGGEQPPCYGARVRRGTVTQAPALQSTRTDNPPTRPHEPLPSA